MTIESRVGVHHGERLMTTMSSGVRVTIITSLICGKTRFGRQFSMSMTHTPVTSMTLPISSFPASTGFALISIGSVYPSFSR